MLERLTNHYSRMIEFYGNLGQVDRHEFSWHAIISSKSTESFALSVSSMTFNEEEVSLLLKAVQFSAETHKTQRRKGAEGSPYVNHPIAVAETLWRVGGVRDLPVIIAAILHDTVEDTETTFADIEEHFGPIVRSLVQEVSDDKNLAKLEFLRYQESLLRLMVLFTYLRRHG